MGRWCCMWGDETFIGGDDFSLEPWESLHQYFNGLTSARCAHFCVLWSVLSWNVPASADKTPARWRHQMIMRRYTWGVSRFKGVCAILQRKKKIIKIQPCMTELMFSLRFWLPLASKCARAHHSFHPVDPATLLQIHVSPPLPDFAPPLFCWEMASVSRSPWSVFRCHTFPELAAADLVSSIKYSWGENERQGEMREAGSACDRHPPDVSFKRKD